MAIVNIMMHSRALQRSVNVTAVIPTDKGYYEGDPMTPERPLKTLYLLNGYFGAELDWLLLGGIIDVANKHDIAIICPAGENKFYVDRKGSGEAFGRFVGEDLVEQTRRMFNLSRKREDTFIGGLSMGGYGALRNGLRYPDTFGAILSLSPGFVDEDFLDVSDRPANPFSKSYAANGKYLTYLFGTIEEHKGGDNDIFALYDRAKEQGKDVPPIFLACGSEDYLVLGGAHKLRDFFTGRGADFRYVEAPGIHDWKFWDEHLREACDEFLPLEY